MLGECSCWHGALGNWCWFGEMHPGSEIVGEKAEATWKGSLQTGWNDVFIEYASRYCKGAVWTFETADSWWKK